MTNKQKIKNLEREREREREDEKITSKLPCRQKSNITNNHIVEANVV